MAQSFCPGCSFDPPPAPNGTILETFGQVATYTCINDAFGKVSQALVCNGTWELLSIECPSGFVTSLNLLPIT